MGGFCKRHVNSPVSTLCQKAAINAVGHKCHNPMLVYSQCSCGALFASETGGSKPFPLDFCVRVWPSI